MRSFRPHSLAFLFFIAFRIIFHNLNYCLANDINLIRVCVIDNKIGVTLTVDTRYTMIDPAKEVTIREGRSLYRKKIFSNSGKLLFGKELLGLSKVRIIPKRDATIYIDSLRLRGFVDIVATKDGYVRVINYLDIEDYLKGVLYREISHRWPYEVLKAQAIAARTYALYQKGISSDKEYDLRADIYSQVYGGRRAERYKTNRAVRLTKGVVLTYKGKIFPTYYHATCGGFTEDANNLWSIDLPPLKGVRCGYCKNSKHFRWKRLIRLSKIKEMLEKAGYKMSDITSIKIMGRNTSGRIKSLEFKGREGSLVINGKEFRDIMGPNNLRSNNYTLEIRQDKVIFRGFGWGHGVGMCQWGAYYMASKGYTAEQILLYYYPGAKLERFRGDLCSF